MPPRLFSAAPLEFLSGGAVFSSPQSPKKTIDQQLGLCINSPIGDPLFHG